MEHKVADCPLGAKCEEVKEENGKQVLYRCPWYIKLKGNNPQGGLIDESACAIAWMPILMIENTKETLESTASIDELRKEVTEQRPEVLVRNLVKNRLGQLPASNRMKEIANESGNHKEQG